MAQLLFCRASASAADNSPFRQNTYGSSNLYADPTKTSTGVGSFADPWTLAQAAANATAGQVVRIKAGNSAVLSAPNGVRSFAFAPSNSGTSGSPIVFVTEYSAAAIVASGGKSGIATDPNRTQIRHAGSAPSINGSGQGSASDTGGPTLGSYQKNYITFDGFYVDMSSAYLREDSGLLRTESCTGVRFVNCAVKGASVTCASNCVLHRPQQDTNTYIGNSYFWGFHNNPTGSLTPQPAIWSDCYGTQNLTVEHCDIDDIDNGIYLKGTAPGPIFNYATIRYNRVTNSAYFLRFNDLDATNTTNVYNNLCYGGVYSSLYSNNGLGLSAETTAIRNLLLHHNTFAKIDSTDPNLEACLWVNVGAQGIGSNVTIRDNIFDINSGTNGNMVQLKNELPATLNYNYYTKNGSSMTFVYNGSSNTGITAWRTATSRDANSVASNTSPFVDRSANNFRTTGTALTMSSTAGEVGAYGGTSETIGVVS